MALQNIFSNSYQSGSNIRNGVKKVKSIYDSSPLLQNVTKGVTNMVGRALPYNQVVNTVSKVSSNAPKVSNQVGSFYSGITGKPQQTTQVNPQRTVTPTTYQGSGMGNGFASNPTNYKQTAPLPVTLPTSTTPPKTSVGDQYMNYQMAAAQRQQELSKKQQEEKANFINQKYALANQQLGEAVPAAQNQFGQFKSDTEATIADLLAGGERQKSQTVDYYGDTQRQAAQSDREIRGQTQRTFANLNTLDSTGEGSFGQATENQASDFNRFTQQNLKAKADKLAEIDTTVAAAERSARAKITEEEGKMNDLVRAIEYAKANNNLQQAQDLTEAFNTSQEYVYKIQDALTSAQYNLALEKEKLQIEIDKTSTAGLSAQFLSTGKPQTSADTEYIFRNPEGASAYSKMFGTGNKSASALQVEGKAGAGLRALDTIEAEILNNSNILAQAAIPGSPGARQYEAALSSITDAIGGLRTGASVSPEQQKYYRNILPKYGDSPETIQYKLNAVRQELQGYAQGANNMGSEVPPELMSLLGLS